MALISRFSPSYGQNYQVIIRKAWLPSPRITIEAQTKASEPKRKEFQASFNNIIQAFQNVGYIGELRQRWEEIKKLTH